MLAGHNSIMSGKNIRVASKKIAVLVDNTLSCLGAPGLITRNRVGRKLLQHERFVNKCKLAERRKS